MSRPERAFDLASSGASNGPSCTRAAGTRSSNIVKFAACTYIGPICNLYSLNKGQAAIRQMTPAVRDMVDNLPLMPGAFPDYPAPIVRHGTGCERELVLARWGTPS